MYFYYVSLPQDKNKNKNTRNKIKKKKMLTFGCKPFYLVDLKLISLQNTHKVKKDKFFSFYFKKGRGTNLIISCESFWLGLRVCDNSIVI